MEADPHSLTSAKDNYYVALSRAQYEAKIYTDDRERLPQAMGLENAKEMALELNREVIQGLTLEKSLQNERPVKEKSRGYGMEWER